MRVTSNTFTNDLVDKVGQLTARQVRLQTQVATGQRVSLPEHDPGATRRVLDLQSEAGVLAQYQRNIANQQQTARATFEVLQGLRKISDRAGEIATLADDLKSPQELTAYATEVNGLIQQAMQLANRKNNGQYLFAGTRTDQAPFAPALGANGRVAGVTYEGNTAVTETEIAEQVLVSAQTLGANTSGSGPRGLLADSRAGADLFRHLIALEDHLLAGDTAAIAATDRAELARDEENLLFHVSSNGALQSRLEASAAISRNRALALDQEVSEDTDVDLAETLMRLSQTQTAYQAALQTAGSVLKMSLLDYIR